MMRGTSFDCGDSPGSQQPTDDDFRLLHRRMVTDRREIRGMLERVRDERVPIRRALNRAITPEIAVVEEVADGVVRLRTTGFEPDETAQIFLNFSLGGVPYFINGLRLSSDGSVEAGTITIAIPEVVYCSERRDHSRRPPSVAPQNRDVEFITSGGDRYHGRIEDHSPGGLGIAISTPLASDRFQGVTGALATECGDLPDRYARVRNSRPVAAKPGWVRLGLTLSPTRNAAPFPVESRESVLHASRGDRARTKLQFFGNAARAASIQGLARLFGREPVRPEPCVVRYANEDGEAIVGIVDSWGETRGAHAVLIPPAWGKRKETLLPLARTIIATFEAASVPVVVLRYDGIRKRGESHNEPGASEEGREHHHFTFSQGVRDVQTSLDFLSTDPRFRPRSTTLVTFSASSIEGRRAAALEGESRLNSWICVVGAADAQSMMRVISGGIDYAVGLERGVSFGLQEILGIEVDMDLAGRDAFEHNLGFIEDSRRDFARITIPVTWFHGKYDAWMDLDRVRDVLAQGNGTNRRLVEIPTGHQLKSSRQALEVFEEIAVEIGRIGCDASLRPQVVDLDDLGRRYAAERSRRPLPAIGDLREFWRSYLLGRDEHSLGIELMHSTTAYRDLVEAQVAALGLRGGELVADLGCGPGRFAAAATRELVGERVYVHGFDYVKEALWRGVSLAREEGAAAQYVECDMNPGKQARIPARSGVYDAAIASLFLSYLENPGGLLREMARIVKPGARVVLSTLLKDADISSIYQHGVAELTAELARGELAPRVAERMDRSTRTFLNDAARLLEYEEGGLFQFWEEPELKRLVADSGFRVLSVDRAFGSPPQAIILTAEVQE